jgi:molybdopterin-guanine dinucleotide biosynthesis protein A
VDAAGDNWDSTQFVLNIIPDVTRGSESPVAGVYAACLVVEVIEDGKKVILIQNTDGVVYQRLTAPGA